MEIEMTLLVSVFLIPFLAGVAAMFLARDDYDSGAAAGFFVFFVALICMAVGASLYLGRLRFDAQAQCHAQRMDDMARPFSADVVCIPYPTRQDTTTINGAMPVREQ